MRDMEKDLKAALEKELAAYSDMLGIAEKKTEILKASKVRDLELLTLEERDKVEEISKISLERESISRGLADRLGINERLDLSTMSAHFTEEGKAEFEKIKVEFNRLIEKLKKVNSLNETLIKDSLEYIDFSLNLMTSTTVDGSYNQSASDSAGTNKKNLFDFKA